MQLAHEGVREGHHGGADFLRRGLYGRSRGLVEVVFKNGLLVGKEGHFTREKRLPVSCFDCVFPQYY